MKKDKEPSLATQIDHDVKLKSRYRRWTFGLGSLIALALVSIGILCLGYYKGIGTIDRLVQISNLFDITLDSLIKGDDSLKKSIVITKNAKAQTNVWEFMRSTGWMMVIAIIYLVTKMIIAVFS